jgi:hypothetical protein
MMLVCRYNLFDWPTRPHSNLVVVGASHVTLQTPHVTRHTSHITHHTLHVTGIANTMDLDERLLKRIASRLGLTKIQVRARVRACARVHLCVCMLSHRKSVQTLHKGAACNHHAPYSSTHCKYVTISLCVTPHNSGEHHQEPVAGPYSLRHNRNRVLLE